MNIPLRYAYRANSWSRSEGFIQYLREENCFSHMGGQQKANPYWWGALLDFARLEIVLNQLFANKSIKLARLEEFARDYAQQDLSPIVRLTGFTIERFVKKHA